MNKTFYTSVEILKKSNHVAYSYIDENGVKQKRINKNFKPTLHTFSKNSNEIFITNLTPKMTTSKLKSLHGVSLVQQSYTLNEYADISYLMNSNTLEKTHYHGNIDANIQFIYDKFHNQMEPDLTKIRIGFIDIEVYATDGFPYPEQARDKIVSISVIDSKNKTVWAWGLKEYDKSKNEILSKDLDIIYVKCINEKHLQESFLITFKDLDFDIVTGWNTNLFDFPYLYNRIKKVINKKTAQSLSPFNDVLVKNKNSRSDFPIKIKGIANLDYLMLYKKYMYGSRESYSLDFIANLELGTTKIDYSEYHNLNDLYNNNHQKFIEYNIYDVKLVEMLEDKLGLLQLAMTIAYKAHCNFENIFSPVLTWDCLLYKYLRDHNIAVPPKQHINQENISYPGAYVKEPVVGLHDWVVTYDLNSLYPMIQIGCNISPETILDRNEDICDIKHGLDKKFFKETNFDTDKIQSGNGYRFKKDKIGFIPLILENLYNERVNVKQQMLKVQQDVVNMEVEIHKRGLKI